MLYGKKRWYTEEKCNLKRDLREGAAYHPATRTHGTADAEVGLEYQGIWGGSTRVIGFAVPGYLGKKID